jgi:hypothetical protein
LITQIIFGVEYRSLWSSLYSYLQSPVTSSLLGLNILLSTQFLNTRRMCSRFAICNPHEMLLRRPIKDFKMGRDGRTYRTDDKFV